MPNTNGYGLKRAILYTRVSTDEQAKSGYSLPEQLRVLREHAIREGHEVVAEIEDDGYSGTTIDRPGLRSIMELAAEGAVDIVLARWRHRYFRSRYYRLVVERDLKDLGVKLVALNDTGNRLADGFQDDFAEWEHGEITKRTLIGKYGKVRTGRVIASFTPGYGFRYNAEKDGLEIDDEEMRVVRRIFGAVASGEGFRGVERMLKNEGVSGPKSVRYPDGSPRWNRVTLRSIILNDLYRPHTYEETKELVSPEAVAALDPEKRYGIWRFGKRRTEKDWEEEQETQIPNNPVAVAVPDSGVLREVVDAARAYIEDNRRPSNAGRRFWELSGGMVRCSECGCVMEISSARGGNKDRSYFYYRCGARYNRGRQACANNKHHRAERLEGRVWELVSDYLKNPERIRMGLERMIDEERSALRGDPTREAREWARKMAEADHKISRFQDMAAEGLITFEQLRTKLASQEEVRKTAERELEALSRLSERIEQLERDRDALMNGYAGAIPERLDSLGPEGRHRLYKTLKLGFVADPEENLEATGVFVIGNLGRRVSVSETANTSLLDGTRSR